MSFVHNIDNMARRTLVAALDRAGMADSAFELRDNVVERLRPLSRAIARRPYAALLARHTDLVMGHEWDHWQLGRRNERLVVREAMVEHLDLVVTALTDADIPCFVVPAPSINRFRVGVPASHRGAVLAALSRQVDPALHIYLDEQQARRPPVIVPAAGISRRKRRRALRCAVWRVYVNHVDPSGQTLIGSLHGCEIEFWTEPSAAEHHEAIDRPLVAERWNKKASIVPADAIASGDVEIDGKRYPTVREFTVARHFDDVPFPVDVVYTWVDGNDPAWIERKNVVLQQMNLATLHPDSHDRSRYRSRDELRFSLRSLAMFADFVRRVFIVTDDQIPPWLNIDHPRITVVGHKGLFGATGRLPTFNSHAIEARLHHIDGLAEHYLYLNDDFFFCRRVTPDLFFHSSGLSKFFLSDALIEVASPPSDLRSVDAAALNSRALIMRHFGCTTNQKLKHAPYPQRRSVLAEMEEVFAAEFAETTASQIRSRSDIPVASSLYHYYAYLTGRAAPGAISARYAALGAPDFDRRLRALENKRNADTLCINDTAIGGEKLARQERRLERFLTTYWPVKSEFEW